MFMARPTEHLEEDSGWTPRCVTSYEVGESFHMCVTSYEVGESFHVQHVTANQPGQNIPQKGVLWLLSREIISLKM